MLLTPRTSRRCLRGMLPVVGANEITAGLRPNRSFLAEQFGGASSASQTQYTLAYRRGGINLLDFLEAQRAYRDTTSEYVRSLGGGWTSFYQLEAAVGGSLGEN